MVKTQITQTADEGKAYERVEVEKLLLDPNNPRLAEYALGNKPTQQELLKILWQKMAVDELAMSIGAPGYFPHEPIFVEEDGNKLVVIEGNRRLAAVMLLLDPEARKRLKITDLPSITPAAAKELRMLPGGADHPQGSLAVSRVQARERPGQMGLLRQGPVHRRCPAEVRRRRSR